MFWIDNGALSLNMLFLNPCFFNSFPFQGQSRSSRSRGHIPPAPSEDELRNPLEDDYLDNLDPVQVPPTKKPLRQSPKELALLRRRAQAEAEVRRQVQKNLPRPPLQTKTSSRTNIPDQDGYSSDESTTFLSPIEQENMPRITGTSKKAGVSEGLDSLLPRKARAKMAEDQENHGDDSDVEEQNKYSTEEVRRLSWDYTNLAKQLEKEKAKSQVLEEQVKVQNTELSPGGTATKAVIDKCATAITNRTFYKYQIICDKNMESAVAKSVYKTVYTSEQRKSHTVEFRNNWLKAYAKDIRKILNTYRNNKQSNLKDAMVSFLLDKSNEGKSLPTSVEIEKLLVCDFNVNDPDKQEQYIWVVDTCLSKVVGVASWNQSHRRYTTLSNAMIQTDKPVSHLNFP